jgi:hypothetical protein
MASRSPNRNDQVTEDTLYVSIDSGCDTHQSNGKEDQGNEADLSTADVNLIAADNDTTCQSRARTSIEAPRSLVAITRDETRERNESDSLITFCDQLIRNVRHALAEPICMTPNQQRHLNNRLASLFSLRRAALRSLPESIEDCASQHERLALYGPHRRPLCEAAIEQNQRAQRRREYLASLTRGDFEFPHTPTFTPQPVRYNDTYNDLIGTRSCDDGSAAAYVERDGEVDTYAVRFTRQVHNGLRFQQGHLHITTENRHLVEARQARVLASLTTEAMDEEITYRVLRDFDAWGWLGQCVRGSDWSERMRCYCECVRCGSREQSRLSLL